MPARFRWSSSASPTGRSLYQTVSPSGMDRRYLPAVAAARVIRAALVRVHRPGEPSIAVPDGTIPASGVPGASVTSASVTLGGVTGAPWLAGLAAPRAVVVAVIVVVAVGRIVAG